MTRQVQDVVILVTDPAMYSPLVESLAQTTGTIQAIIVENIDYAGQQIKEAQQRDLALRQQMQDEAWASLK